MNDQCQTMSACVFPLLDQEASGGVESGGSILECIESCDGYDNITPPAGAGRCEVLALP